MKRGGHLLLVVPSLDSALLATFRHTQWNLRTGHDPGHAQRLAAGNTKGIEHGIVHLEGVPTKHYLREELEALHTARGFAVEAIEKIEYPWNTEFDNPPRWMREPYPWDWFVVARKAR